MIVDLPLMPPLNDQQLAAVGRVVVLWAQFETHMDRYLRIMTDYAIKHGHDEHPNIKIPFNRRIQKWKRCTQIAINNGIVEDDLLAIIDRVKPLRDERDKYVHGTWYSINTLGSPDLEIELFKNTEMESSSTHPQNIDAINKTAGKISWLICDLLSHLEPKYSPPDYIERPEWL